MRISPLQMYENDDLSGIVTKANLGYQFGIKPQEASKLATMIHQANFGTTVSSYLNRFDALYLDSDDDFTWDIITSGKKNIPLVKASLTAGGSAVSASDKVGKNLTEFYLTFAEKWFTDVNQIVGERNEVYPIYILDEPRPVGMYWEYRCRLNTGSANLSIPYEELQAGKRFSKDFSPVSDTMSKKGGGVNYNFPFKMKNSFTTIRMQDTVPGNMIDRPVQFSWKDHATGKTMTTWMDYRSYQFEMQYQEEIAKMLMYATSNKTSDDTYKIKDKGGYELKMGAGIRQQMESSNYYSYPSFNINKFTDMLLDLSIGKIVMGQREVTVMTGERGMVQFSKALEYHSTLYTPARNNDRIYSTGGNGYGFKGQFLEYVGPQGIKVNIMHDALKDDFERNKLLMGSQPGLAESYVYDILNMGTSDGKPNIQKVYKKSGGDVRGYEPGLRDPYTMGKQNRIMSNPVDAWTEHRFFQGGAIVYDPTRVAVYKPNILG